MTQTKISIWLEKKFIEWVAQTGNRQTITAFAEWLDISRPLLSSYINGSRQPSRENADKLSKKLGEEIYDLLGLQRPDQLLQRLQNKWDKLTQDDRAQIEQVVERLERVC